MSAPAENDRVTITPYRDGPYLVRGAFALVDQHGNEITLSRRTVALCRCGRSRIRPFCDGTHRAVGFRAEGGSEGDLELLRRAEEPLGE
ncbi:MAG TPA: CDGSH iron-sulfur domain-containing protein [Solirubrobacteraceae bacterium]|nr:CDGSH iron-sulfur domain-containing protein [Solirubrobacteraceae bacterium]